MWHSKRHDRQQVFHKQRTMSSYCQLRLDRIPGYKGLAETEVFVTQSNISCWANGRGKSGREYHGCWQNLRNKVSRWPLYHITLSRCHGSMMGPWCHGPHQKGPALAGYFWAGLVVQLSQQITHFFCLIYAYLCIHPEAPGTYRKLP